MPKKNNGSSPQNDAISLPEGTRFFKSSISGLTINLEIPEDRSQTDIEKVRFTPYRFFNEKTGENYEIGYLATDESDALEILSEDYNVAEIDQEEYEQAIKHGTKIPY